MLYLGVMYRVCGLLLGPNFGVRLRVEKFYLRLTVGKMHAFAVFNKKYLRLHGCIGPNFTATVNCRNLKLKCKLKPLKKKSLEYKSTL